MPMHFPGESTEYRQARERVLQLEIELRRAAEAAARARRELPPGGVVPQDYVFEGVLQPDKLASRVGPIRLSELFGARDTLVIYSYMFGPEREQPCPMCTPLLDGLDAVEPHIRQRASLVVVGEAPIARLLAFARDRGWRRLRLISAAGNQYNRDYYGTTDTGDTTMLNVFRRDGSAIRHFWGSELTQAPSEPGQDHRAIDMLSPIFATFDLTPEGRGDFYTKISYG